MRILHLLLLWPVLGSVGLPLLMPRDDRGSKYNPIPGAEPTSQPAGTLQPETAPQAGTPGTPGTPQPVKPPVHRLPPGQAATAEWTPPETQPEGTVKSNPSPPKSPPKPLPRVNLGAIRKGAVTVLKNPEAAAVNLYNQAMKNPNARKALAAARHPRAAAGWLGQQVVNHPKVQGFVKAPKTQQFLNHRATRTTLRVGGRVGQALVGNPVSQGIINNVVKPPVKLAAGLAKGAGNVAWWLAKNTYKAGKFATLETLKSLVHNSKMSTEYRRQEAAQIRREAGIPLTSRIPEHLRAQPHVEPPPVVERLSVLPAEVQVYKGIQTKEEFWQTLADKDELEKQAADKENRKPRLYLAWFEKCLLNKEEAVPQIGVAATTFNADPLAQEKKNEHKNVERLNDADFKAEQQKVREKERENSRKVRGSQDDANKNIFDECKRKIVSLMERHIRVEQRQRELAESDRRADEAEERMRRQKAEEEAAQAATIQAAAFQQARNAKPLSRSPAETLMAGVRATMDDLQKGKFPNVFGGTPPITPPIGPQKGRAPVRIFKPG